MAFIQPYDQTIYLPLMHWENYEQTIFILGQNQLIMNSKQALCSLNGAQKGI